MLCSQNLDEVSFCNNHKIYYADLHETLLVKFILVFQEVLFK